MAKKLKAKIIRVKNNIVFDFKFRDPIDKRDTYFNDGDKVCFGACRRFMGEIESTTLAKVDLENMVVTEI